MSADSRGGCQEASGSVPILVSRFVFPFPSLPAPLQEGAEDTRGDSGHSRLGQREIR